MAHETQPDERGRAWRFERIVEVELSCFGGWVVRLETGWQCNVPPASPYPPQSGEVLGIYCQGDGSDIEAMTIGEGTVYDVTALFDTGTPEALTRELERIWQRRRHWPYDPL